MSSDTTTSSVRLAPDPNSDGAQGRAGLAMEGAQDDELVRHYVAGDDSAFDALYNRHRGPLYRYFKRQTEASVAHDLYQETWMKFIKAAARYQANGKFQAYLFQIAHNVLMDYFRKQKGAHLTDSLPNESVADPGQMGSEANQRVEVEDHNSDLLKNVSREELRECLHEEVARLPVHQRTTWLIKQESQLSMDEIAKLTQTTLETVRSRLRYANEKLKQGMQRYV